MTDRLFTAAEVDALNPRLTEIMQVTTERHRQGAHIADQRAAISEFLVEPDLEIRRRARGVLRELGGLVLPPAAYLLKNDCNPCVYRSNVGRKDSNAGDAQDAKIGDTFGNGNTNGYPNPAWCPIHQREMKRWDKEGRIWYSHKVDGMWCSGK